MRVVLKYEIEDACCIVLGHNQGQQGTMQILMCWIEQRKPSLQYTSSKCLLGIGANCPSNHALRLISSQTKETEKAKHGTAYTACDQGSGAQAHLQRYSIGATFEYLLS